MRLGLGLGFTKGLTVSFPDDPRVTSFYDSLGNFFKANASASGGYNDQIEVYFDTAGGVQDMATDGCFLLKSTADAASGVNYLIDDDSGSDPSGWVRSTLYNTIYAALTSGADTSDAVVQFGGTNDANASGGLTVAKYKQGLQKLKEFVKADFVNAKFIVLNLVGALTGGDDTQVQIVREAVLETISSDSFFKRGIEYYDLPRRDAVHPTDAAFKGGMAARQALNLAVHAGGETVGGYGALVTGAEYNTDSLTLSLTHDGGDDITVTAGCEDVFGLDVDGTIYQPSLVSRVDATTLKLDFDGSGFDPADMNDAKIVYGAMSGLTQAAPETVKDNSTNANPLRSTVITPTQEDPLIGMDYTLDISAKLGTKTLSGSDVTAITGRNSTGLDSSSGRYPLYDASKLNGAGALYSTDTSTSMRCDTGFTGSSDALLFFAGKAPSVIGGNYQPLSFGSSSSGQTLLRANLINTTSGELFWGQNSSNVNESLVSDIRGDTFVLYMNFTGLDNVDWGYYSDTQSATGSFDPRDALSSQTYIWLFAISHSATGGNGLELGRLWFRNSAHGEDGDASINDIVTYLRSHYGAIS